MPARPFRPCSHPGCSALLNGKASKCPAHLTAQRAREDERRDKAIKALYGTAWRQARAAYLRQHPLCVGLQCQLDGLLTPACVVDHIRPHKGDRRLFWDVANWQALCKPCHDSKTATHDGGFGRAARVEAPATPDDSLDDWA